MTTIDLLKSERHVATLRVEIGVRIVEDFDYIPMDDAEAREFADRLEAAYGVVVILRPADSLEADWARTAVSVWGCVVDASDDNIGDWPDLARIPDTFLRELARDQVAEYLAQTGGA